MSTMTAAQTTARAKAQMAAARLRASAPARRTYDHAEAALKGEYNYYAGMVEHYNALSTLATSERGRARCAFRSRLAGKMKDDLLEILCRYEKRRSLRDMAAAFHEACEERRELIKWARSAPQGDAETAMRAASEIDSLREIQTGILRHIRGANPGRAIAAEADYVLATLKMKWR